MDRAWVNRISELAPLAMSWTALTVVILAYVFGWERGETDEGAVAHIFQLLIAGQAPLIGLFLFTADWRARPAAVGRALAMQAGALCLAMAPVAILRL